MGSVWPGIFKNLITPAKGLILPHHFLMQDKKLIQFGMRGLTEDTIIRMMEDISDLESQVERNGQIRLLLLSDMSDGENGSICNVP